MIGTLVSFGLVTLPILARDWIDGHRQPGAAEEVLVYGAGDAWRRRQRQRLVMATRMALSGFGLIGVSYLAPSGGVAHLALARKAAPCPAPCRRCEGSPALPKGEGAATRGLARSARSNVRSRTAGRGPSPCVM